MTNHDKLKQDVLDAIVALYGDTSVSMQQTFESLTDIRDEIRDRIATIEEQLEHQGD